MNKELDLNIDNWTVSDLYELFDIQKNATTNEVAKKTDKIIQKQTDGELKFFLQGARNKIIKFQSEKLIGDTFGEDTDIQLETWWKNQFLTSGDSNQNDKITDRNEKVEIFDDNNGHYQMKRNKLGVNQTYQLPYVQGTMNPNLVNEIERVVVVDSQYRTDIYPYAAYSSGVPNPTLPSFNTDMTFSLSESLANVTEMTLESINIPKTWDNFSTFLGNNTFFVKDTTNNIMSSICILAGHYSITGIVNAINTALTQKSIDLSFNFNNELNRIYIVPGTTNNYEVIFYDKRLVSECADTNCFNVTFTNNSMGWSLGWRTTPDVETSRVSISVEANTFDIFAEAPPKMQGIEYLILVVDDFNKNRLNTGIISAVNVDDKLKLPDYTDSDNLNCDLSNNTIFTKVAPRKLTQAQLFTINKINQDRKAAKNRNTAPTTSDAFCTIPIPSTVQQNENIVIFPDHLGTYTRKYFGPVTIERLKARLLDDKGNPVALNGRDWSFSLRIKQLYQY